MRRFYQTEWQGIRFNEFARVSAWQLAGAEFYEAFYAALFARYASWDTLPAAWRAVKQASAQLVLSRMRADTGDVLSVGCGLGYMEHLVLLARSSRGALHVQEIAPTALKWLAAELPAKQIHIGFLPQCLPAGQKFDLIYLCGVDYALPDPALIDFLRALRERLTADGELLLISGSYLPPQGFQRAFIHHAKGAVKLVLDTLGLRPLGQLWGWQRNREEYRAVLEKSGFPIMEDGPLPGGSASDYWVAARAAVYAVR